MRKLLCAAVVSLGLVSPVSGQDYAFQGFATDMAMSAMHASVRDITMGTAESAPLPTQEAFRTTYTASAEVSAQAQQQFIAFIAQTSGTEGAAALENQFRTMGPADIWAQLVASEGLRPGDAVDAVAGYWMLNWLIANEPHDLTFDMAPIVEQVRMGLAQDNGFRSLTEPQRQEFSEILMMNFLVQQAVYNEALMTGNRKLVAQLGDAAVARFQNEAGVNLRALTVTDEGFVER